MKRMPILFILLSFVILITGCKSNEKVEKVKEVENIFASTSPEELPGFIQESDFEKINWDQKAVKFDDERIIGNENKSGVIGADMPSLEEQKWMWLLWGIEASEQGKLTIVGFNKETKTTQQILTNGWAVEILGATNGADAHAPSSVKIPEKGEWAFLLYTDEKLFDILVLDIQE